MNRMITNLFMVLLVGVFGFSLGCGGSSTQTDTDVEITTIDGLPKATSPVEASTSASVAMRKSLPAATTGLPLGSTTASSFDSTSSLAACEMFNMTKQSINSAAQGDLILCYIQNTFAAATTAGITGAFGGAIDIYDGGAHTFGLDFSGSNLCGESSNETCSGEAGESDGPHRIQFRITRNASDVITSFEMFACNCTDPSDSSTCSQNEYLSQTISGSTFSMLSQNSGSFTQGEESSTFGHQATVSGTLNANGNFSDSKVITMDIENSSSSSDFWGHLVYTQTPTLGSMAGYMQGSGSFGEQDFTFVDQIVGSVQLIEGNTSFSASDYDIGLLAMGNGAVKGCVQGGGDGFTVDADCTENAQSNSNSWIDSFAEAWNGDDPLVPPLDDATESDYYDNVVDESLPTATQSDLNTFAGDRAWNCSDTPEATINFAAIGATFDSCARLSLNHQHIDCWHIAGEGAGGEESLEDFSGTWVIGNVVGNGCMVISVSNGMTGDFSPLAENQYEIAADGSTITVSEDGSCVYMTPGGPADSCSFTGSGGAGTIISVTMEALGCSFDIAKN